MAKHGKEWAAESPEGWLPTLLCTPGLPGRAISPDPSRVQAGARLGQELIPSAATGSCMSTRTHTNTHMGKHTSSHSGTWNYTPRLHCPTGWEPAPPPTAPSPTSSGLHAFLPRLGWLG